MTQALQQISQTVQQHSKILRKNYHVKQLGVFGSVARGGQTNVSDIDMLVDLIEPVGLFQFIDLENYLSQLLGKKVDLVTKAALKPAIKDDILKDIVYV